MFTIEIAHAGRAAGTSGTINRTTVLVLRYRYRTNNPV
jgi:hypothetical protein